MKNFWKNKKVYVTGHNGFKGSWLVMVLHHLGAVVKGTSLINEEQKSIFKICNLKSFCENDNIDIRELSKLQASISTFSPDILFHLAAQPLVREAYKNPLETYSTNVIGTQNVLECLRNSCVKAAVMNTTDKVYENKEWIWSYKETDRLGGHDPYSSSKACCEILIDSYRKSYEKDFLKTFIASARSGNVIGGGDFSKDRLIPDIIESILNSNDVKLRNPSSTRPWQHVLDPIYGYLILAEKLYLHGKKYAQAWNFGPKVEDCLKVFEIAEKAREIVASKKNWIDISNSEDFHEANLLKLDTTKTNNLLMWKPKWNIDESIRFTVEWYVKHKEKSNMLAFTNSQIKKYFEKS